MSDTDIQQELRDRITSSLAELLLTKNHEPLAYGLVCAIIDAIAYVDNKPRNQVLAIIISAIIENENE